MSFISNVFATIAGLGSAESIWAKWLKQMLCACEERNKQLFNLTDGQNDNS